MARGISLRNFRPEDAPAVHRWFNSPAATANLLEHREEEFTEDDARRWVQRAIDQAADPKAEDRKWAVEVEGIEDAVGFTALYGLNRQTAPELGEDREDLGNPGGASEERVLDSAGTHALRLCCDLQLAAVRADRARPGARPVHEHAVRERNAAEPDLLLGHREKGSRLSRAWRAPRGGASRPRARGQRPGSARRPNGRAMWRLRTAAHLSPGRSRTRPCRTRRAGSGCR